MKDIAVEAVGKVDMSLGGSGAAAETAEAGPLSF
jgi:hypothetical protein